MPILVELYWKSFVKGQDYRKKAKEMGMVINCKKNYYVKRQWLKSLLFKKKFNIKFEKYE